jgi:small subunit ribosomal protein S6
MEGGRAQEINNTLHRHCVGASPALELSACSRAETSPDACPEEGGGFVNRDYELGFILQPEVKEEQTRATMERIEQIVNTYGGQIMRVNQWGRRRLAYPIDHHRDGLYVFIDMVLTPETVSELDRTLKVSEDVLRHLIKKRDPKAVQKEREARAAAAATLAQVSPAAEAAPQAVEAADTEEEQDSADAEIEMPVILTAEEDNYVPPAIEEETVEA